MSIDILTLAAARNGARKYTDKIASAFTSGLTLKGAVNYYSNLPSSGNIEGDCYIVLYKGTSGTERSGERYAWTKYEGTLQWILVGKDGASNWADIDGKPSTFPPTGHNHDNRYYTKQEVDNMVTRSGAWTTEQINLLKQVLYNVMWINDNEGNTWISVVDKLIYSLLGSVYNPTEPDEDGVLTLVSAPMGIDSDGILTLE